MSTNANGDAGRGAHWVVGETREERMDAYDQLPRELREMIDLSPVPQSPTLTLKMWRDCNYDTQLAMRVFAKALQTSFPGYTPPRRRPRPVGR